ncbi:MerR family transcriptional regulator [Amycolatopsis mongoliensis]|uniref:MerR family transcriptional regulator n=1 Tax=Amycolatopsis mongoliensis TaxID=715475 RepID=A0A9Y2JM48_9PSEU|nr:MerR family transcriptional regulator [Amycolatopsis sp. 4-36]WIY01151.1 MerR family transcriptional regulator [Amycolatopsis sp. 4-36]
MNASTAIAMIYAGSPAAGVATSGCSARPKSEGGDMAWSTRQLAELAGTTVKAVRYYHRIGLLELPDRALNGYKQYRTAHLARLLRIKRLTELGFSLGQIKAMEDSDAESAEAIDVLDAELAATIERLQRIRSELAVIREHRVPPELPASFGAVVAGLPENDRAMLTVFAGTLGQDELDDLRRLMEDPIDSAVDEQFDHLPADADDATIEVLAGRLAESIRQSHARFPWMANPGSAGTRGTALTEAAVGPAIVERLNSAQLKTLVRAHALVEENS